MATSITATTAGVKASGTSGGGSLQLWTGDGAVFDGGRIVIKLTFGAVSRTFGSDDAGQLNSQGQFEVSIGSGIAWEVHLLTPSANTSIPLIISEP